LNFLDTFSRNTIGSGVVVPWGQIDRRTDRQTWRSK